METDKLKAFIVVAEELNFRRSAQILGMSQPPLSRLISSLEDEMGAKLFERTTRQVRLTGAGLILLKEARLILAAISKLKHDVGQAVRIKAGKLRIGFSATAFLARLPVILEEFQNLYPKIKLDLTQGTQKEILRAVQSGEFDAGFVEGVTEYKELARTCVSEEVLGALLKKNHRLAKRAVLEFKDLGEETLILHHKREAEEFYTRIAKLIQGLDRPPSLYIRGPNESCPILVATGKGIALTVEGAERVTQDGTKFVPIKDMFLPVSLFWQTTNPNPSLGTFISAVEENRSLKHSPMHCLSLNEGGL